MSSSLAISPRLPTLSVWAYFLLLAADFSDSSPDEESSLESLSSLELEALRLDLRLERFRCLRLDLDLFLDDDSLRRDERFTSFESLRDLRLDDLAALDDFLLPRFRESDSDSFSDSLSEDDEGDSELELSGDGERFLTTFFSFAASFMGGGLGISLQMLNAIASRSRLRSLKNSSVSSFWK
jgi:hypothetical protein